MVLVSNVDELANWYFLALNPYVLKKCLSLIRDCVSTKDQLNALLWEPLLQQSVVLNDLSRCFSGEYSSLHFNDDEAAILILKENVQPALIDGVLLSY